MCYETHVRFNRSLREIFSKPGSLRVRKKSDESALMQILQEFGTLEHVDCQGVFQNGILWKCSHADFTRLWDPLTSWLSKGILKRLFLERNLNKSLTVFNFQNKVAMTTIFFFKMFKTWCRFQKWIKQKEKVFGFKDNCIWMGTANSINPEQDSCHLLRRSPMI